ncbi:MAG: ribonuclease P protein component [Dysgonamonadaceae bacterium]|nr:ribonuclease P protein component [Dysgonamonadaceae bacterium]
MDNRHTFRKKERISRQKEIDALFEKGTSFIAYPLRVVYVEQQPVSGAEAAVLVGVSKKKFKRAVRRNRVKRLIREAYRLNKQLLLESLQEKGKGLLIGFLFVGNGLPDWKTVETAMVKALTALAQRELT